MTHNEPKISNLAILGLAACLLCACDKPKEEPVAPDTPPTPSAQNATADASCTASGALQFVCGLRNAEDIVQLGNSEWLIVSGMSVQGPNPSPGRVYLVNHKTKIHEEWFPAAAPAVAHNKELFGACPGPVNTNNFSPHGLALREQSSGRYRLYMTSHGEREAIEVFDVDASAARPSIAWIGCVVLPEKTFANSVAILSDGGFVTTKMVDSTESFPAVMSGAITGLVYEWHPGGKVTALAGTESSGANGIEISQDQRWLFVAGFGSRDIVRYDRNSKPLAKQAVQLDIRPDNLRWTSTGKLYTVGGNFVAAAQAAECANPPCSTGWSVYEIDPQTMQATRVTGVDQTAALQGASTALEVGNEIWVGTYSGDRIGYLPKP